MDEKKNCDLLFEYLRSILYDKRVNSLDYTRLDPAFQKLGQGLNYLEVAIAELKKNSAALSKGELSEFHPSRENPLCDNLKNIHANLEHLTWQAIQVAKGDYSQHVSYLGEFSNAFNTMTAQLAERERKLRKEAIFEHEHSAMIEKYNRLLLEMIARSKDDIIVSDRDTNKILYCSKNSIDDVMIDKLMGVFQKDIYRHNEEEWSWQYTLADEREFHVITVRTEWESNKAYAHYVHDYTEEKKREELLRSVAEVDALTHIANRYAFEEYMQILLQQKIAFTLCYCDLDHLKLVNDMYGHLAGDTYLCTFVGVVKDFIRDSDYFARIGGDEFCIILKDCNHDSARVIMDELRHSFAKFKEYGDSSFSYGFVEVEGNHPAMRLDTLLQEADENMYRFKKRHHVNRK